MSSWERIHRLLATIMPAKQIYCAQFSGLLRKNYFQARTSTMHHKAWLSKGPYLGLTIEFSKQLTSHIELVSRPSYSMRHCVSVEFSLHQTALQRKLDLKLKRHQETAALNSGAQTQLASKAQLNTCFQTQFSSALWKTRPKMSANLGRAQQLEKY